MKHHEIDMKTTYIVKREDSQGKELERMEYTHFNESQIQGVFNVMVMNSTEGDSIEYLKIDTKAVYPCMLYVEIVNGKPYTFTNTGKRKEYTVNAII